MGVSVDGGVGGWQCRPVGSGVAMTTSGDAAASAQVVLSADHAAPRAGRRHLVVVCHALGTAPRVVEVALVLLSELVTNAVLHGRSNPRLAVGVATGGGLYVGVGDDDSRYPVVPDHDVQSLGGRGLHLVRALATRWPVMRATAMSWSSNSKPARDVQSDNLGDLLSSPCGARAESEEGSRTTASGSESPAVGAGRQDAPASLRKLLGTKAGLRCSRSVTEPAIDAGAAQRKILAADAVK